MATLRYKNPTTQKWELVGVNGGGSTGESQIVFSKLADFPTVGESDKVYIVATDNGIAKYNIETKNFSDFVGNGVMATNAIWANNDGSEFIYYDTEAKLGNEDEQCIFSELFFAF